MTNEFRSPSPKINIRKMNIRIILTLIVTCLFAIAKGILAAIYSPMTGALSAAQLEDTVSSYAAAKLMREGSADSILFWLLTIAILIIWAKPLFRLFRSRPIQSAAILLATMQASCTPVKIPDTIEVQSNETAWAIPLDGATKSNEVKFNSVGFLNDHKIATKRIWVDKVSKPIGRFYWDIEWIPSVKVITVDRSLVTRQWNDGKKGSSADDQGVAVVTKDSVKLRTGLTVTATIEEDDASTYLYYHGSRAVTYSNGYVSPILSIGRPLWEVMDSNVRSFCVAELTKAYAERTLSEAQTQEGQIYSNLYEKCRDKFKTTGITVSFLGNAEALTYEDPNVQNAINKTYLAEQDRKSAVQEQEATKIRNATLVMNAQTESDAANKLLAAKEATSFKNDLNIRTMTAQANLNMSSRWNGQMPANILPANSPMLMQLGSK